MQRALDETDRRRSKQVAFNQEHNITPQSIRKAVTDIMEGAYADQSRHTEQLAQVAEEKADYARLSPAKLMQKIKQLENQMYKHSRDLEFEEAARIRDEVQRIRALGLELPASLVS
jgi:excinuclease ABC subunit B